MLWVTDGSWEEEIIAGEEGVRARESGYGYNTERLVEKDQKEQGRYCMCSEWIGAEGLAG